MAISSELEKKYHILERATLEVNVESRSIAMLKRVSLRKDQNKNWFLGVVLADRNGKAVYGNLFDVEASEGSQHEIENMLNRAVSVTYMANLYRGRETLNISSIQPISDYKDIALLERLYFRAEYQATQFETVSKLISIVVGKIHSTRLQQFIQQKCPIMELQGCADNNLFDGMVGAPIAVLGQMMVSANTIMATQPDLLTNFDSDYLLSAILYCQWLEAKFKPLYKPSLTVWQTDMISRIATDRKMAVLEADDEVTNRFFNICENIAWRLAGVEGAVYTVTQIYLNLKRCAEQNCRVINITAELPGDAVVTIGQHSYSR